VTAGTTLLEVLMASLILVLAIVPTIGLFTGSQTEVVKSRNRFIASNLASGITEDFRARVPAARVSFGPVPANDPSMTLVTTLLAKFGSDLPAAANAADLDLAGFRCTGVMGGPPAAPTFQITIAWKESGVDRSLSRTVRLEGP
jgi:hypothetical protein